jgi:mutator protein MutT
MDDKSSNIRQASWYGAYAIIWEDQKILLTLKKSGPYKSCWGLPGGGIEFGETPEEALKRELLEEVALSADHLELWNVTTAQSLTKDYRFYHIGIIYRALKVTPRLDRVPEDEMRWESPVNLKFEELTPFAREAIHSWAS